MKIEDENTQSGFVAPERDHPDGNRGKLQLFFLFLVLLVAITGFAMTRGIANEKAVIAEQESQLTALRAELEEYQQAVEEKTDNMTDDGDGKTVSTDDTAKFTKTVQDFLKTFLTWDTYSKYTEIRNWLMTDYGLTPDSQVLTSFMPEVTEEALGNSNMRYTDVSIYEVSRDGDLVSYFALCSVRNRIDGNVGNGKVAVFYSIGKDGNLSNISAYALAR